MCCTPCVWVVCCDGFAANQVLVINIYKYNAGSKTRLEKIEGWKRGRRGERDLFKLSNGNGS